VPETEATSEHTGSDGGSSAREYAAGGLGALLVLALIIFLGYQALVVRETGPEISVEVTQVEAVEAGYAVRVEVRNGGGTTAEGVLVSGHLVRDGREIEQASTTMSYVPPNSVRSAALVFSEDPRNGDLTVGPDGYALP
jgi:uncharacterized protein (TIGR02588 family)